MRITESQLRRIAREEATEKRLRAQDKVGDYYTSRTRDDPGRY